MRAAREEAGLAYGVCALIAFTLPYSRLQESESDRLAPVLMAQTGYDPPATVPFW